ncbi:hypothetical protein St703_27140 [Sporolactobacillus terrae]|uniref:Uncharacterized protein n=1 Tax=Sporolactobacillus terrae TaxID=269673 RepID=A0A5K7X1V0_9BACL|nr:hypothetical protein St703_27140 [Sporolactobacillus terrae]
MNFCPGLIPFLQNASCLQVNNTLIPTLFVGGDYLTLTTRKTIKDDLYNCLYNLTLFDKICG